MSGSSLDGLDICYVRFQYHDEKFEYEILQADCIEYTDAFRERLRNASDLSAFEFAKLAIDKLMLKADDKNVIVYKESKFDFVSIDYINSQKYQIKPDLLKLAAKILG